MLSPSNIKGLLRDLKHGPMCGYCKMQSMGTHGQFCPMNRIFEHIEALEERLGKAVNALETLADEDRSIFKTPTPDWKPSSDFSPSEMWKSIAKGHSVFAKQALAELSSSAE
jgi:hypothetical protein